MNANTIVAPLAATIITIGALAGGAMGRTVAWQSFEASEGYVLGQSVDLIPNSRWTRYDGVSQKRDLNGRIDGPSHHFP